MARSIAFFTNKGGVGKTTMACNIAHEMAKAGNRVLLIDADPQCNATIMTLGKDAALRDRADPSTLVGALRPVTRGEGASAPVRPSTSGSFGIDVLAATPRLALAEDFFAREWFSAKAGLARGINVTLAIRDMIRDAGEGYDRVVIDCGPSLGSLNRAVLLGADFFVSPVMADVFSYAALSHQKEWVADWSRSWRIGCDMAENPHEEALPATFLGTILNLRPSDKEGGMAHLGVVPWGGNGVAALAMRAMRPIGDLDASDGLAGAAFFHRKAVGDAFARIAADIDQASLLTEAA